MTTPTDKPLWKRIYEELPGNRSYALTPESERELEILWQACGQDKETFNRSLDELVVYGPNAFKPVPRAAWVPPPTRKDSHGREMTNPYLSPTRNREDQRAVEMLDPELAAHLKAMAQNPWSYQLKLDADEQARLRWNEANESYDHTKNVFVNGDKNAQNEFVRKCQEEKTPERLEIARRESLPVKVALFGPLKSQNRDAIHAIGHDKNAKLLKIIVDGQALWKELEKAEFEKAEEQRKQDALAAHRQQQALNDLMKGVERKSDGRIITHQIGYGK